MQRLQLFLLVLLAPVLKVSAGGQQETLGGECPPSESFPVECICEQNAEFERTVKCTVSAGTDYKKMFDQISEASGTNPIFEELTINSPAYEVMIPANVMTGLKFGTIQFIFKATQGFSINSDAFPSTYQYTTTIGIQHGRSTGDPYPFIRNFTNLKHLSFFWIGISKIVDNAFKGLRYLETIEFDSTGVSKIGLSPFAYQPTLTLLNLTSNQISSELLSPGCFEGVSPYAEVNLEGNRNLTYLPENVFKVLLDSTRSTVRVGREQEDHEDNQLVCDVRSDWICLDGEYQQKLKGFHCLGDEFKDVFDYCKTACPANDLLPIECSCTKTDYRRLECSVYNTTDFKLMFDQVSEAVESYPVFDGLRLATSTDQQQFTIPEAVMTTLQFKQIELYFRNNELIIDPNAFPSTYEYTTQLEVTASFDEETDPFLFVRKFSNLEGIYFSNGDLPRIENLALDGLQFLQTIYFFKTGIREIGLMPFAFLPNVTYLDLDYNRLTDSGLSVGTFEGLNPAAHVRIGENTNLTHLSESVFKVLLDTTVSTVRVGYEYGSRHLVCDERADWICQNVEDYEDKLVGFYCVEGPYDDVFDYCRGLL